MANEQALSPYAFSKCELLVQMDGQELRIPINFGMSDVDVRKIYPYLLSMSRIEDNPMAAFQARKDAGEFKDMSPDAYEAALQNAEKMARYWYERPTSSIMDVAIGIGIDFALRKGQIEIDPLMQEPAVNTLSDYAVADQENKPLSPNETIAVERKYGMSPDAEGQLTLRGEVNPHKGVSGDGFKMYGDDTMFQFMSKELMSLELQHETADRMAKILSEDYEKLDKTGYESIYDPTKPLDMTQVSGGILKDMYGDPNRESIFDKIEEEERESVSQTEPEPDELQAEDSVAAAMQDLGMDDDEDYSNEEIPHDDEDDPDLDDADFDEVDFAEGLADDGDE